MFATACTFRRGQAQSLSVAQIMSLTESEILGIFEVEDVSPIPPLKYPDASLDQVDNAIAPTFPSGILIDDKTFNPLHRCQSATLNMDGTMLTLSSGSTWGISKNRQSTVVVRLAYWHHWEIIRNHFVTEIPAGAHQAAPVILSGSPGTGKSVESLFLINRLFHDFPSAPAILYVSPNQNGCVIHYEGHFFAHDNYNAFCIGPLYKILATRTNGRIWHIYDSMHFAHTADIFTFGPVIIITSPGRASEKDMRDISKLDNLTLYLPLPSPIELEDIRAIPWANENAGTYVSRELMGSLILKFGCIPRTIFELGHNCRAQECILAKFKTAGDVERVLDMVGGSDIDHEVGSGSFFHIVPVATLTGGYDGRDSIKISERAKKRSGHEAGLEEHNLSESQRIAFLRESYQTIVYVWASDFIRDLAFQTFLTLTADRMLTIILNHAKSAPSSFRGLLLEPFVHKLLNESGVRGRMKNLESGKDLGVVLLGPWPTKNIYESHAQLDPAKGVYNVPLKSNEPAIDSVAPYDGYAFQITSAAHQHGINRPKLDDLIKTGVFDDYKRRNSKKAIKFVWIVEAKNYDNYILQSYHNRSGKAYAKGSNLKYSYPNVTQFAFEVDMRRVYKFHSGLSRNKPIDMADRDTLPRLEKVIKRYTIGTRIETAGEATGAESSR